VVLSLRGSQRSAATAADAADAAAAAAAAAAAPEYQSLAAGPSSLGASYRSLAAEPTSPVRVVTSFEELEAAMARAGVPRVEPLPLTRETERATRAAPYLL